MKTIHDEWLIFLNDMVTKDATYNQIEGIKLTFYAGALIQLKGLFDLMNEDSITTIKLRDTIIDLCKEAYEFLESKITETH